MNPLVGLLRFLLASSVIICHFWTSGAPGSGPVAVVGFFFISGFLITYIRVERYADIRQIPAFVANRALRIFPLYWAAISTALLVALFLPITQQGDYAIGIPRNASDVLTNIIVYGLYGPVKQILPQTWSLHPELIFYVVIGLGTAPNYWTTLVGFIGSLGICLLYLVGAIAIPF